MCDLGTFVRETDVGVVPVFAWRAWKIPGTLAEPAPATGPAWHLTQTNRPALATILRSLGATQLPGSPVVALPRIAPPPDDEVTGKLQSFNGATWVPNEAFRAVCRGDAHGVIPSRDCSCGVYALRQRRDLKDLGIVPSDPIFFPLVIGMVALWGRVLEYDAGYRAELAYPAGLILHRDISDAKLESIQTCARLYQVPVITIADEDRRDAFVLASP